MTPSNDRVTTYPSDALKRVVDRLQDEFPNLPGGEAEAIAFDLTVDVVAATDKLRAIEAAGA